MTLIWPFPTRDPSQFQRVDQGWDLQAPIGTPLLAVADGTISFAHDPLGFGDPYPVLLFDQPYPRAAGVYYGHNRSDLPEGSHVAQGDVIGHTLQTPGGSAAGLPGWLEIGWWYGGPTGDGQLMHDVLINAPLHEGNDMPLTQDDLDKITIIAHQQAMHAIAESTMTGGLIAVALGHGVDNANIHTAIALNTVAAMLGFKPPYPDQPAKATDKA